MTSCPFCDIVHGTGPVSLVYEDDLTMAFIPLQPIYPGACIVIPKVHIDHFTDLPDELAVRIMVVSQRIGRKIMEVYQPLKVGMVVHGFGVRHAHMNLIPPSPMRKNFMFTSESVTPGHPDKLCDQISDAIVDRMLQQDAQARVVTECAVSTGVLFLAARFDSNAAVDFTKVARRIIEQVGYDQPRFNSKSCTILTSLEEMPEQQREYPNIDQLSDSDLDQIPAMDQATVFGFACNQTPEMMPLPVVLAHQLARHLDKARQESLPYLNPDGKTQVGVEYKLRHPKRIHSLTLVASQKESAHLSLAQLRQDGRG